MKILKIIGIGIGIILLISLILTMPFILDVCLYSTHVYDSHLTSSEWSSFNGSYIGAVMGGIVTLIGIWITIKFQQKQANRDRQFQLDEAERDRKFQREQANEDRRLAIAPYLKYKVYDQDKKDKDKEVISKERDDFDLYMTCNFDSQPTKSYEGIIKIENVGMGAALDINICEPYLTTGNAELDYQSGIDVLEKEGRLFILMNFSLRLEKVQGETRQGILKFKVKYKDLLQNEYEQEVELKIFLSYHLRNDKWLCDGVSLEIIKTGKPQLEIK